jgi:limonene-1,2-epoxide hydrolase
VADEDRSPEQLVRDFCAAWSRLDLDELMEYFAPEAVYHNMPGPPLEGRDAVREGISRFLSGWDETVWEVLNIAAAGDVVLAERVDRTKAGGHSVDLPVTGVFEVRDGKIVAWRDYFDLATYQRAMTPDV